MKDLKQSKIISILSLFIMLGCEDNKSTDINIVYLFDVTGSYHESSLKESASIAQKIFTDMIGPNGIPFRPHTHQVSTIDEMSVNLGSNCITKLDQVNIFDDNDDQDPSDSFKECINNVLEKPAAHSTDIRGALLTASKSLQNDDLRGKGLIIFSDLHEYVNEKKDYPLDLKGVSIFVVFEWSTTHIKNPELQEYDKNNFIKMLESAGCDQRDVKFMNLSSVSANPEVVSNWFRKQF